MDFVANDVFKSETMEREIFFDLSKRQLMSQAKRALVVEDDESLKGFLSTVMRTIDPCLELFWVVSARDAVALLSEFSMESEWVEDKVVDLFLVDVFLEGKVNGIELWRILRERYPRIPVVLMSSKPLQECLGERMLAPFEKPVFIQKPFSFYRCAQTFQAVLNNFSSDGGTFPH
jgi:DNA-binding NtrC family response regulator